MFFGSETFSQHTHQQRLTRLKTNTHLIGTEYLLHVRYCLIQPTGLINKLVFDSILSEPEASLTKFPHLLLCQFAVFRHPFDKGVVKIVHRVADRFFSLSLTWDEELIPGPLIRLL